MPRPKTNITQALLSLLKSDILKWFGKTISTHKDILELSKSIRLKTGNSISNSTLYRLFGLQKNNSIPYKHTLNILCEYVNYSSWDSYSKDHSDINSFNRKVLPDDLGLKLLEICIENHDFKSVMDYIKLLPEDLDHDSEVKYKISNLFGKAFRKDKIAREALLPELAKIPQGRHFFFEYYVDIDFSNRYFSDGLNHYIKWINPIDKKEALSDFVFANAIQFISNFYAGENVLARKIAHNLFSKTNLTEINPDSIKHPLPIARYYGCHLIYKMLCGRLKTADIKNTINDTINLINYYKNASYTSIFLGKLFESLYFTEQYDKIIELYEEYENSISYSKSIEDSFISLIVYSVLSFHKMNKHQQVKKINLLLPEKIHFSKYQHINALLLLQKDSIINKTINNSKKIDNIISITNHKGLISLIA